MSARFPTARRAAALAGAALSVAGAAGLSGASTQAVAAPEKTGPHPSTSLRTGVVHVKGTLTGRSFPTTRSEAGPSFRNGTRVDLDCKVYGPSVQGNDLWYGIPITGPGRIWVSARYVDNAGPAPAFCRPSGVRTGTATTAVNRRSGPSARDAKTGRLGKGSHASVVCYVGPAGSRWYYTRDHSWVDARYLKVRPAAGFCANR